MPAAARSASRFSDPIFRAARRRAASSSRRGSKLIDSCSGSVLENGDDLTLLDELVLGDQHLANRASIAGEDADLHLHALDVDYGLPASTRSPTWATILRTDPDTSARASNLDHRLSCLRRAKAGSDGIQPRLPSQLAGPETPETLPVCAALRIEARARPGDPRAALLDRLGGGGKAQPEIAANAVARVVALERT